MRRHFNLIAMAMLLVLPSAVAFAQTATPVPPTAVPSVGIEFSSEDLGGFFDWFNTIFEALLPIGLLAAGLTAGGLFVWVISRMLINAFKSMTGGSSV